MARKVYVDLSDTINTFRVKTNTIAAQIGDLDDLNNDYTGHDSDIVQALNLSQARRRKYTAGNGILKTSVNGNVTGDSSGAFSVAGGHGLTQEASGLKLEDMPANTVKVRDAGTAGASSNKEVTDQQILIGDGTGFTSAALSQDVLMTNAGVVTIQPDVVTNDKLANMSANTVKVNATGSTAGPTDLLIEADRVLGRDSVGNLSSLQVTAGMIAPGAAVPPQDGHANQSLISNGTSADWALVTSTNLHSAVTLVIYNSTGTAVKTLYGAGS